MIITLSAVVSASEFDNPPVITGDALSYRDTVFDLSQLTEGGSVGAGAPFIGEIKRINGVINCTLEYRYNAVLAENHQSTDWADYTFNIEHGQVPDPIKYKPAMQEAQ